MSKTITFIMIAFIFSVVTLYSQSNPKTEIEKIIEKNIETAGGLEILSKINAYSFDAGPRHYYISTTGIMKMTSGKDPVITEIILTTPEGVIRNCYNRAGELRPLLSSTYQALAKLRCGFFTLMKFADQLEYQGEKKIGSRNYIVLTSKEGVLDVEILVDTEDYRIKRFSLKGFGPEEGNYEINHEINSYQEVEGIKLPTAWFSSQLDFRGILHEISNIQINPELKSDFFSSLELNAGQAEAVPGHLKGNIMRIEPFRETNLMISTNWTKEHTLSAGFNNGDELILEINGEKIGLLFFELIPPKKAYNPGSVLMIPSRSDENYVILLLSSDYKHLIESLTPLFPIQISKID
jgi:hypothetical protein